MCANRIKSLAWTIQLILILKLDDLKHFMALHDSNLCKETKQKHKELETLLKTKQESGFQHFFCDDSKVGITQLHSLNSPENTLTGQFPFTPLRLH